LNVFKNIIDYLAPELTPYELSFYLFLFRNTYLERGKNSLRIGKRTIASKHSKSSRGSETSYEHTTEILKSLEKKDCIKIGDVTKDGTLYTIFLPSDIPLVAEKMKNFIETEENYFDDSEKRLEIFKRDDWICQYCGEKLSLENATIDHFIPKSKGGNDFKDNLKTCCFMCNSIKSGKTYEEASPYLLKNIIERKKAHFPK